jgi:hypothetical protein
MKKIAFLFALLGCLKSFAQPVSINPTGSNLIIENTRPQLSASQETELISACAGNNNAEILFIGQNQTQASIIAYDVEKGERKILGQFKSNNYNGIHCINEDFLILTKQNGARSSLEMVFLKQKNLVPSSLRFTEALICSKSPQATGFFFVNKEEGADVLYQFPTDGKAPQLVSKLNGSVQSAFIDKNGTLVAYTTYHKNELCLYVSIAGKPATKIKSWQKGVFMNIEGFNEKSKSFFIKSNVWGKGIQTGSISIENGNPVADKSNPANAIDVTHVISSAENLDAIGFVTTGRERRNLSFTEKGKQLLIFAEKSIGNPQFSISRIENLSTVEIFKIESPEVKSKFIVNYKNKFIDVSKGSNTQSFVYRAAPIEFNTIYDKPAFALFFKGNSTQASTPPLMVIYSNLESTGMSMSYSAFIQGLCSTGYDVLLLPNPSITDNPKFDVNDILSEQSEQLNSLFKKLNGDKRNNCQNICIVLPEELSILTPAISSLTLEKNTLICSENFDNQLELSSTASAITHSDESIPLLDIFPMSEGNARVYSFGNASNLKSKNQSNKNFNFTFSKALAPSKEFIDVINAHFKLEIKIKVAGN